VWLSPETKEHKARADKEVEEESIIISQFQVHSIFTQFRISVHKQKYINMSSPLLTSGKRKAPSSDGETPRLMWTKGDEKSWLSDWQIKLVVDNETEVIYNVHRSILVTGVHYSRYFIRLFQHEESFVESKDRMTQITDLNQEESEAFPILLNYLYDETAEGGTSGYEHIIYRLADYFGIDKLREDVLLAFSRLVDSKEFSETYPLPLVSLPDVHFLEKVLGKMKKKKRKIKILAEHCWQTRASLDKETFQRLTNMEEDDMPLSAAPLESIVQLLKAEHEIMSPGSSQSLTSLQSLGIEELSERWEEVGQETIRTFTSIGMTHEFIQKLWLRMVKFAAISDPSSKFWDSSDSRIILKGAGISEVNGVYHYVGDFHGRPMFSKEGIFEGESCIFAVYCFTVGKISAWQISCYPPGHRPCSDGELDLYNSKSSNSRGSMPPRKGWDLDPYGEGPCPRLIYKFED
jgi:hypothetical protein